MNMSRRLKALLPALAATLLIACGGGDSSSTPPPPPAPIPAPSSLNYAAPPAFTVGTAITTLTPAVTGAVTAYTVSPALPAGLAINATTGAITGTPMAIAAAANYQVTATNTSGSTSANVPITVNDVVPSVGYPAASYSFTTEVPIAPLSPVATGGAVLQWSIDRALPAGLTFSTASGQISGTPTTASASTAYVVTAANSGGSDTFNLSIGVQSGVLLDLGHIEGVNEFRYQGTRVMSSAGRGILWNAETGAILASVESCTTRCIALAGPTAVFQTNAGFKIHSSADGTLQGEIAEDYSRVYWWVLGADGSYVCDGTDVRIACWDSNGTPLFTRAGDYRHAQAFGATGQLRVAKGPGHAQVIENIAIPSGVSANSAAFPASFHSWFSDGEKFLTVAGANVAVYSRDVAQLDFATLPTTEDLGGQNNWFWTSLNGTVHVYAVGSGATPVATYSAMTARPSHDTLILRGNPQAGVGIVDLSGASLTKTDYDLGDFNAGVVGTRSATDWVTSDNYGVVARKLNSLALQVYNLGRAWSIAGSASRFAVATASGRTLYFDSATRALEGEITSSSVKLEISDDGTRLATGPSSYGVSPGEDRSLRIYSLPSETLLHEWPYSASDPVTATNFTMSGSGGVIGLTVGMPSMHEVSLIDGTPLWSQPDTGEPLFLSPDGTRAAVSTAGGLPYQTSTSLYANGALTTALTGKAIGWADNSRLLVNRYHVSTSPGDQPYDGIAIVDTAGLPVGNIAIPEIRAVQRLPANTIYSPERNEIYDLTSGGRLWSSAAPSLGQGAVAGSHVIFASGATVRAEPR
jgi:hypothetical protein